MPELQTLQPTEDQQLLPTILSKTGARVDDFVRQVVDLTAHEQITQETLDKTEGRKSESEYSYLVLVHRNDLSRSPEEYRVDAKGNRVAPGGVDRGYAVTSGFAFKCLHFLPANQPKSTFRFLGTEPMGGRSTYVVAFAQGVGQAANTNFVDLKGVGVVVPIWLQGITWIDQESLQILRMRTDLLEPLFPNALLRRHGQAGDDQQTTGPHTRKHASSTLPIRYGCPAKWMCTLGSMASDFILSHLESTALRKRGFHHHGWAAGPWQTQNPCGWDF